MPFKKGLHSEGNSLCFFYIQKTVFFVAVDVMCCKLAISLKAINVTETNVNGESWIWTTTKEGRNWQFRVFLEGWGWVNASILIEEYSREREKKRVHRPISLSTLILLPCRLLTCCRHTAMTNLVCCLGRFVNLHYVTNLLF